MQMEELRVSKDMEIEQLTNDMEQLRVELEDKINGLELTLGKYQQMTIKLEAANLEA